MEIEATGARAAFVQANHAGISLVGWLCLLCVLLAGAILAHYLIKRPPFTLATKLRLLLGLGVFPALAAATNVAEGMRVSTQRSFCGECHVMTLHTQDSEDPSSQSLAARHARNPFFGDRNCYVCHADYGYLGYPLTKLNGMKHVWEYYTAGFRDLTPEAAQERIHLYKPYNNANCMQCHSGTGAVWQRTGEHVALRDQLAANAVSCASEGCHGFAHPFTKQRSASTALSRYMDLSTSLALQDSHGR
jgi:nitrate/TMAO reductase-like tetraheme cytochrome c subunit